MNMKYPNGRNIVNSSSEKLSKTANLASFTKQTASFLLRSQFILVHFSGKGGLGSTKFVAFEKLAWHNECFFCALCKVSMVGKGFIQGRRRIYRTGQLKKFTKRFLHLLTSSLLILVILLQSVSCSCNLQAGFTSADVEALDLQSLGVLMLEHLRNLFYIVSQVCTA